MRTAKTADTIYVDPSALRALYVHDDRSRAMSAWRRRHPAALPMTQHAHAEMLNAFALGVFRGEMTSIDLAASVSELEADLAAGRLYRADLSFRRVYDRAAALSTTHTPTIGARSLDVLHVASALELGCIRLLTYDARQSALARAAGLRVDAP